MEVNLFRKGFQNKNMEVKILMSEKEEIELELENLTMAEILRVYLNKDSSVAFAAWRRDHPSSKPVLKVKTKGKSVTKAISDAVSDVIKDLDRVENDFAKMK